MKLIKFFTTFSKYGYLIYGKTWIETFLEATKAYPNITATVYVNGMNLSERKEIAVESKLEVLDFDTHIPEHRGWIKMFDKESKHSTYVKKLCKKFSFKSFVMLTELENISDGYAIWLDADCIFKQNDFNKFPEMLMNNNFLACQIEGGSEHIESGFVAFDTAHKDKQLFTTTMKSFYMEPSKINSFGELFDGFVLYRTISHTKINVTNLNEGYGLRGVQSDPNCTFLNPAIGDRFFHNIGITGKRNYSDWSKYARHDEYFKVIHGVNPEEIGESTADKIKAINKKLSELRR
jgi:hypothetical protein